MKKKSKSLKKYRIGIKLNFLTILEIIGKGVYRKVKCRCDCGTIKEFYLSNITPRKGKSRYTKSCGCKNKEMVSQSNSTHGMSKTKFYKRWRSMFDRILPSYVCADSYTGIKVCKKWTKFENFYKDMFQSYQDHKKINNERQTTLDRINPFKGYSKENCRWATQLQQANNKKFNYEEKIK